MWVGFGFTEVLHLNSPVRNFLLECFYISVPFMLISLHLTVERLKKTLLWILMNSYDYYILSLPIVPAKSYKLALEVKTRYIVFRKYSKRTIWFYSKSLNFSELKQPSAFLIMFFLSDIFICIYFLSKQRSKRLQRRLQMTHWIKCRFKKANEQREGFRKQRCSEYKKMHRMRREIIKKPSL